MNLKNESIKTVGTGQPIPEKKYTTDNSIRVGSTLNQATLTGFNLFPPPIDLSENDIQVRLEKYVFNENPDNNQPTIQIRFKRTLADVVDRVSEWLKSYSETNRQNEDSEATIWNGESPVLTELYERWLVNQQKRSDQ